MASNCDIPITSEAHNYGLEEFTKAYMRTQSMEKSLNYAISQINNKYNTPFDTKTFVDPIVKTMKDKGLVSNNYQYGKKKISKNAPSNKTEERVWKQEREQELKEQKSKDVISKRIASISEKMKGLNSEQKKEFIRKATEKFYETGILSNDEVKNLYAEASGLPAVTPELNEKIDEVVKYNKAIEEVDRQEQEIVDKVNSDKSITEEQAKGYIQKIKELDDEREKLIAQSQKSRNELSKAIQGDTHWQKLPATFLTLNYMTPKTLLKNLTGMGVDFLFRSLSSVVSTPLASFMHGKNLMFQRWKGASYKKALKRLSVAAKTGAIPMKGSELDRYDYLNSVDKFKEAIDSFEKKHGKEATIKLIGAAFRLSPDMIKRGLGSGDYFVYTLIETGELNRIAAEKGLKGAEKAAFLAKPDEASAKRAEERAKDFTLKTDLEKIPVIGKMLNSLSSISYDSIFNSYLAKGVPVERAKYYAGAISLAKAMFFPYVGAPVNLYKLGFKIALPEVTFGIKLRKYLDLKKTDPEKAKTLISEATGDFVVGELVRFAAIAMVSNGLISAGYDDDDERTKEAIYKVSGGPNRINVTGFFRGLAGGKFENKEGDDWRDLSSMGYLGMTLAGYGHAYHGMTKEEADQFTDLTSLSAPKNIANMNLNMVLSEMKAGLDMPFLTGYNQIQDVLKSNDGSKLDKFILNSTKSLMTTMVPATHQQLSRSVTGDVYASYDKEKTLSQNVFDALGYNFFFQGGGDMKKKMNTLSETEKDVKKAKEHMLFDNTLGRMLYNLNPFGTTEVPKTSPINKLYNEIMKTPQKEREQLFPSEPKNVVNLGGKNNAKYVTLNQEQYDYYRQMASMWRMFNATPYIMSEDFDKDDTTTKTETLQKLYSKGLTAAKILLKEKYPDLKDMATEDENSSNSKERVQQYNRLD